VFSLQQLCGHRLILGVGAGSTQADFDVVGANYANRFADFTRNIAALREIFRTGALGGTALSPWPAVLGGPPLFLGSWGNAVTRAARRFDGWIASANYRTPDEVVAALARYRAAGGGRAIVSTIQLPAGIDLGELKARLDRFADAGFDDAVVMFLPGGPTPAQIRRLVS
jgi:alkanesulfonate monooxygenase SsuD/methylene tetrahydromethanopterin reductase-like flavin-dependent oxidoreductase (luciferase family)